MLVTLKVHVGSKIQLRCKARGRWALLLAALWETVITATPPASWVARRPCPVCHREYPLAQYAQAKKKKGPSAA